MLASSPSPIGTDWSAYASGLLLPNLSFGFIDWSGRTTQRPRADSLCPRALSITFSLPARLALRVGLPE
jgi:hypothetical protein